MATQSEREIFARNLRRIVEASHMNSAEIARKLGISRGSFSDYMHGRAYPRPEKLTALCQILNMSQYDLTVDLGEDDFVPNKEILRIAKEIYGNPDARAIYKAIEGLDSEEIRAIRTLISKLTQK